jgi:hypothetical protein
MRKMLSAWGIAGLLLVSGASAGPVTISFDGACNTAAVTTSGISVNAVLGGRHCQTGLGTGLAGKNPDGQWASMAVLFDGDPASYFLMVTRPFVTGGHWFLFKTTNGINGSLASGTYTVSGTADRHPRGTRSITTSLRGKK